MLLHLIEPWPTRCHALLLRLMQEATSAAAASNGAAPHTNGHHSTQQHAHHKRPHYKTSWLTVVCYAVLFAISKYTLPKDLHPAQPTLNHVWYYGWVTAISTGLGAVPLAFASELGEQVCVSPYFNRQHVIVYQICISPVHPVRLHLKGRTVAEAHFLVPHHLYLLCLCILL